MWLVGLGLTLLVTLAAAPVSRGQGPGARGQESLSFPVTLAAAPNPQVSAPELAQRLGCWACHSLSGQGGQKGSPLDFIGARLSPEDLHAVLTRPRSRHPQAKMPSYAHLRPWEMQALVDYLKSLGK